MNKQHAALTVALTGQLSIVLIAAAFLALAVSLLLLRRYRRAVIRSMQRRNRSEISNLTGFVATEEPYKHPGAELGFNFVDTQPLGAAVLQSNLLYRQIRRRPWLVAIVYAVAGLCFAATMTAAFLLSAVHAEYHADGVATNQRTLAQSPAVIRPNFSCAVFSVKWRSDA